VIFTVFTPTHDRAHTLSRVFSSLKAQTFRSFEWVIVDDGSTDQTETLVNSWIGAVDFPISYHRQPQGGKHRATNRGVAVAKGDLFLTLDSDDACVPTALERLYHHWSQIPADDRAVFSAVTALCQDQHGNVVGGRYPKDVLDSDSIELRYRYRVSGEKWGFQRIEVMRAYPFPDDTGTSYMPEGLIWNQIARTYKTRYVNEALRIYYVDGPSMVHQVDPSRNAEGGRFQHLTILNTELDWFLHAPLEFLRSAIHYVRFSCHCGIGLPRQVGELRGMGAKMLWLLAGPVGLVVFGKDRLRVATKGFH